MTGATEGMVGGGYYDAHSSFQADTAASVTALLQQAVAALTIPADGEVTVADYGCSEGRNSMATVTAALGLLAARGAEGLSVVHNDLPTNDWNTLARNLSGAASYLVKYPQARALFAPRGFFEQVVPPAIITLGTSGSAAHWLSRQPLGLDMPRSLYRSDAPPSELAKILKQAADDWLSFLTARAEELQPSGVLLVQMLGADGSADPARVSASGLLKLMNDCALQLVDAGEIPKEVYARYCFPVVPRTIEEARSPVMGALADKLELLHCGLTEVPSPYQAALEKTGDVAAFAKGYTAFTRAFSESSLRDGVFKYGKAGADVLADRFYAAMETALTANPRDYPFDDLTLAVMVRRRG
jgi:gibberellin A4 carboxyl methyltransferase